MAPETPAELPVQVSGPTRYKSWGRRELRQEIEARQKLGTIVQNASQNVAMAPRKLRRMLQGKNFLPVYGYRGLPADEHTEAIRSIRAMDLELSDAWTTKLAIGRALVRWGEALTSRNSVS